MMNAFPDEQVNAARDLLREHFPEVDWTERRLSFHAHFLTKSWLNAGSLVPAVEEKKELERLDRIESLIKDLWTEYHKLPLAVRSHLPGDDDERDIWQRIMRLNYDLTGKTPFVSTGAIQEAVARRMPRKQSAIAKKRARVSNFFKVHHTQREAEISKKIHLAAYCYDLWLELKGKAAPKVPSEGSAFYKFVSDVIQMAGKDWNVEVTLRKYHLFQNYG